MQIRRLSEDKSQTGSDDDWLDHSEDYFQIFHISCLFERDEISFLPSLFTRHLNLFVRLSNQSFTTRGFLMEIFLNENFYYLFFMEIFLNENFHHLFFQEFFLFLQ